MKINKLVYVEMKPDEGKIFYDGNEYTDYVCVLESAFDESEWQEVDIPEDSKTKKNNNFK